ncbi:hypothetical protein, partial [Nocardia brasiliensis]|uniref:hypothetical protein n=1 Tax=Nocardia brasiliensis TaxID=37326 RepID=UPI0024548441
RSPWGGGGGGARGGPGFGGAPPAGGGGPPPLSPPPPGGAPFLGAPPFSCVDARENCWEGEYSAAVSVWSQERGVNRG